MSDIEAIFTRGGGYFHQGTTSISQKLANIHGFLFDWDGVFNAGRKSDTAPSDFSESVSMGVNMLRFSFYLKYGKNPTTAIITGEQNPAAVRLARREHFDAVFMNVKDKKSVVPALASNFELQPENAAFFFDDILDLSLSKVVRLPVHIRNAAAPMLEEYIKVKNLALYITGKDGGDNGLREACELLIALNGNYKDTIGQRVAYTETYQEYLSARNSLETTFYSAASGSIEPFNPSN